jgi:hypothetical protein
MAGQTLNWIHEMPANPEKYVGRKNLAIRTSQAAIEPLVPALRDLVELLVDIAVQTTSAALSSDKRNTEVRNDKNSNLRTLLVRQTKRNLD